MLQSRLVGEVGGRVAMGQYIPYTFLMDNGTSANGTLSPLGAGVMVVLED